MPTTIKHWLKALYRLYTRGQQKPGKQPILINSIPKSGTHLLKNIILAIPGTQFRADLAQTAVLPTPNSQLVYLQDNLVDLHPHRVYIGHIPYIPALATWLHKQGIRQLFIYRDPRDYTISLCHYIMRERHNLYTTFAAQPDHATRLLLTINGSGAGQTKYSYATADSLPNVSLMYHAFLGWRQDPTVLAVRYEDLIGPDGILPEITVPLRHILAHLHIPATDTLLAAMQHKGMDPTNSPTFRQGHSQAWRTEYTQEHCAAFTAVAGELLTHLGYNWE